MKTSDKDSLKILIIAAEASSCMYASELLKTWEAKGVKVSAFGVGSREMEALGFKIIARAEDLAVMGLQEILSNWSVIKKAFYDLVDAAKSEKPDLILLMDYPEFNMRFAKKMKALSIPIAYYISPQIWAWRTYRVHKIKKLVDLMLVIFPFEKEFYSKYGVPSEFVGHPLIELLHKLSPAPQAIVDLRAFLHAPRKHLLGIMPGSRRSEIKYNLQAQIEVALEVQKKSPEVEPVILVAPSLNLEDLKSQALAYGFKGELIQRDPFLMIQSMDTILCASGTATLMVGICRKPMVIMYKMNSFTAFFAKRLVKHIPYFGMVNLILNEEAVPERFQEKASVEEMTRLLLNIIHNVDGQRTTILQKLDVLKEKLGGNSGGDGIKNLANSIEKFILKK